MKIGIPVKVADASVLSAWVFRESRAEEAGALLDGIQLREPTLLGYELTSVARKKSLRYPDRAHFIARALEVALRLDIVWVEVDHADVLRLALSTGLTSYDATYLSLARALGVPLVTFDTRLLTVIEGKRPN